MLRRIGVLASLAVVAAMFAGTSSAQATAGVCVFEGLAGTLEPDIPPISADLSPDFEQGAYEYTGSTAACAGEFGGEPEVSAEVQIDSAGLYDNILCGTGFAHDVDGSDTTVEGTSLVGPPVDANGEDTISIGPGEAGYEIAFVAGVGALRIGAPGDDGHPSLSAVAPAHPPADPMVSDPDEDHDSITSDYTGAGIVQISPGTGPETAVDQNCLVNDPVSAFQVAGFFVATGEKD